MCDAGSIRQVTGVLAVTSAVLSLACEDTPSSGASTEPPTLPGPIETSIDVANEARVAIEDYFTAVATRDFESARAFYAHAPTTLFRWIEDGASRCLSSRQLRKVLRAKLADTPYPPTLTSPDLAVIAMDSGSARATCHFLWQTSLDEGAEFHLSGWVTVVMTKWRGRWRFVSGHIEPGRPATIVDPGRP